MDHPVRFWLLFATGTLLGLLLLPLVPEFTGVFIVVCGLILGVRALILVVGVPGLSR